MTSQMIDDNNLLKASNDGNADAFGALVQKYQSYIRTLTYSATGRIGNLAVPEIPPYNEGYFDGLIDEVCLYNRVLSDEEVRMLAQYQPGS